MDRRVLVVDDDSESLRLLGDDLAEAGYTVLKATNGRKALEIATDQAPPIMITDWSMPQMDGPELVKTLREHDGIRFIYIIVMATLGDDDRLVEAFNAGADDFVSKPIRRRELLARLHAAQRICRLEDDLAKRTREIHRLNAELAVGHQELGEMNLKLKQMATTDELTSLLNRREAMERLKEFWGNAKRYGLELSCIMMDIDHFKRFNDTYGHAAGDAVLRETAFTLRESVRDTDLVCRLGGEELLVICPNVAMDGTLQLAERLRTELESTKVAHDSRVLRVTMSLGVASYREELENCEQLLKEADDALYSAKAAGRNCVRAAAPTTEHTEA